MSLWSWKIWETLGKEINVSMSSFVHESHWNYLAWSLRFLAGTKILQFHDFIIPICWARVNHILLSRSGKTEKEVRIRNENNSLITGKAGLENVAQTTESKRSLLVLCLELHLPPGPGEATGQALVFTCKDRPFSSRLTTWRRCRHRQLQEGHLTRERREGERSHGQWLLPDRRQVCSLVLVTIPPWGEWMEERGGEKFLSNTTNLVEVSLLSSEVGTWGIEDNVSSFMIQGWTPQNRLF